MTETAEPPTVATENTSTPKRMASLLESVSYWTGVAAVGFTALAAAAGLFAWYFSSKLADRKDAEFRKFKETSATETARANERAAQANARAEEARLKLAEVQSLVEWRTISDAQMSQLRADLASNPSSVEFVYVANDPEASFFAILLSKAFENWNISSTSRTYSGALILGLTVVGQSQPDVARVREAFTKSGLSFSEKPINLASVGFGGSATPPAVEIIVGSKPRPIPK